FQIMFALQNAPMSELELPGLSLSGLETESKVTRFDMEVHIWEFSGILTIEIMYDKDLFDDTTIERMAGQYKTLLESIIANPEERISELQMLTEAECEQLLIEWNSRETDYPKNRCIHELFEE